MSMSELSPVAKIPDDEGGGKAAMGCVSGVFLWGVSLRCVTGVCLSGVCLWGVSKKVIPLKE